MRIYVRLIMDLACCDSLTSDFNFWAELSMGFPTQKEDLSTLHCGFFLEAWKGWTVVFGGQLTTVCSQRPSKEQNYSSDETIKLQVKETKLGFPFRISTCKADFPWNGVLREI